MRPPGIRQAPRTKNPGWVLEAISRTETFTLPVATCRFRPAGLVEVHTNDMPRRRRTWTQKAGLPGDELVQLPGVWNSWSKPGSKNKTLCVNAPELRWFNLPAPAHNERPTKNAQGRTGTPCHPPICGPRRMWHVGRRCARCWRQCLHCLLLADLWGLAMAGKGRAAQQKLQQLSEKTRNGTNDSERNLSLVPSRAKRCGVGKLRRKWVSFLVGHAICPKPFWRGTSPQPNS